MSTKRLSNLVSLPWKVAEPHLQRALGGYDPSAEVAQGLAFPFYIGKPHQGAFVLVRTEQHEMVVVAFEGVHKLKDASLVLLELAKAIKATTIRIHTERKGEQRYLNRLGLPFELVETRGQEQVLRMVI
ncbi:hypothetical protein OPW33_24285 [Vibrio europaeus]|uniref:hypothetical protein n=1 Tax=Vibrio europaeus TaxID=300876 RepID=UPI00234234D5|nr:hypothetical protein [Vibrio europaeus]MDC5840191.1 hypothetical protein [Vibrio europaeus]MDC5840210.1 hypothetical protein [Vibrio europaeus]MDC5842449.1 hypothetical protein [Vibrio europaeus]